MRHDVAETRLTERADTGEFMQVDMGRGKASAARQQREELTQQELADEVEVPRASSEFPQDWADDVTRQQREIELRTRPTPEHGKRPWDFSCPYPGCDVRQSRFTDPDIAYSSKARLWFCSSVHREAYLDLRFGH